MTEPPGAMWAAGALRRQVPADATASQLSVAVASVLPLLPDDRTQASSDPLVKLAQHRGGLAEAEVSTPSDQIAGELFDDLPQGFRRACAASAPGPLP